MVLFRRMMEREAVTKKEGGDEERVRAGEGDEEGCW